MSWNGHKDLDRSMRYTNQMQKGFFEERIFSTESLMLHWAASLGLHPHSQNEGEDEDYTPLV